MSCNIEYKEDKKFCSYCGGSLVNKEESISSQKKADNSEKEKSDGKIICPHCKIVYEFGNSCIQCGAPLGSPIPPQPKEEIETPHPSQVEGKSFEIQVPQEQKIEILRKHFICPDCDIIYERGNTCVRCGATLVDQLSLQAKEEMKTDQKTQGEGETLQAQISHEQQIKGSRKHFICPHCKIIHERGNTCMTCGAPLVIETQPHEKEKLVSPSPLEIKKKEPIVGQTQKAKQESQEAKEGLPGTEIPEQKPPKRSSDDLERRLIFSRKRKKEYRRLFLDVGRITIMVVAGGYFLWSIYSYLVTKRPEPRAFTSKEVSSQVLPSSPASNNPIALVTEQGEFKNNKTKENSSISKEKGVALTVTDPSSILAPSNTSLTKNQEIEDIKSLLENIRQANLQKNIDLFISCYATDFKDREGKKKTTLTHWKNFDYLDLIYDLKSPSISSNTARAKVEWLIKISSKTGGQPQESKTILDVTLKKEESGWKIKEVKQVG